MGKRVSIWGVLVACICLQSLNGSDYLFASYSQQLKRALRFDQRDLDAIAFSKTFGSALGVGPSLLFHLRFSPPTVALIGIAHSSIGFALTHSAIASSAATTTGTEAAAAAGGQWQSPKRSTAAAATNQSATTAAAATAGELSSSESTTDAGGEGWQSSSSSSGRSTAQSSSRKWWRSAWAVGAYQFLASSSQTYVQTAVLIACLPIFPHRFRSHVVAVLKGFIGLSAAILLRILPFFCSSSSNNDKNDQDDDPANDGCIPLTLAWLLPLAAALPLLVLFLRGREYSQASPSREYTLGYSAVFNFQAAMLVLLAFYLSAAVMLESLVQVGRPWQLVLGLVTLVILTTPTLVLLRYGMLTENLTEESVRIIDDASPLATTAEEPAAEAAPSSLSIALGDDFTTMQALCSSDFWLMFVIVFLASGCTGAIESNFSQLGHSLGYTQSSINSAVSLFSISNCIGRLGSGFISERFLTSHGVARPHFFALAMLSVGVSTVWAAVGYHGALYGTSILVGLSEGTLWCLSTSVTSELFGLLQFSTLVNIITFACIPGTYVFSVLIVGRLYDSFTSKGSLLCYGTHCFFLSFLLLSLTSFVAALLSCLLAFRSRKFYSDMKCS